MGNANNKPRYNVAPKLSVRCGRAVMRCLQYVLSQGAEPPSRDDIELADSFLANLGNNIASADKRKQ
jgi:hypothetical protein